MRRAPYDLEGEAIFVKANAFNCAMIKLSKRSLWSYS